MVSLPIDQGIDQAVDPRYLKERDKMYVAKGVLYRKDNLSGQEFQQLVLPPVFRDEVFQALHYDLGHQGRDGTTSLFKQRFFWPGMDSFVRDKVKTCGRCTWRKIGRSKSDTLGNITSNSPKEIGCLDYRSLEWSKGGKEHFFWYAQAIPGITSPPKRQCGCFFFFTTLQYIMAFRYASKLATKVITLSQSLSRSFSRLPEWRSPEQRFIIPWIMARFERFNQTLLQMLVTLEDYQESDWALVHAHNAMFHDSTGYSLYFLMFGRHPMLALDAFHFALDAWCFPLVDIRCFVFFVSDRVPKKIKGTPQFCI